MEITWIVNNINQVGGIERVVLGLSDYFVEHGMDIIIVSINTDKSELKFHCDSRVKIEHCGIDWRSQKRIDIYKVVRTIMRKSNSQIVIGCHEDINLAIILNKSIFKGKVVVTQHISNDFFTPLRFMINVIMYRFADKFVVLSDVYKREYEQKHIKNCQTIPNAISRLPLEQSKLDNKVVISAGRLTKVKDFEVLIRAFKRVNQRFPEWKLIICGEGEERNRLEKVIEELSLTGVVQLVGYQPNVMEWMKKSSVFVCSSYAEGFPMVGLEALACGLPIVSFRLPSIVEMTKAKSGIIVEHHDEKELAEGILCLLEDTELRIELGKEAYECAKRYDIDNIGKIWIDMIISLKEV